MHLLRRHDACSIHCYPRETGIKWCLRYPHIVFDRIVPVIRLVRYIFAGKCTDINGALRNMAYAESESVIFSLGVASSSIFGEAVRILSHSATIHRSRQDEDRDKNTFYISYHKGRKQQIM